MTIIIIHVVCINNINLLFSASGELSIDMNQKSTIREHHDTVSVVKTPSSGWVISTTVTLLFTDHSYR